MAGVFRRGEFASCGWSTVEVASDYTYVQSLNPETRTRLRIGIYEMRETLTGDDKPFRLVSLPLSQKSVEKATLSDTRKQDKHNAKSLGSRSPDRFLASKTNT